MNRKLIISTSVVAIAGIITFVKPVQTLALDALSVFRVNDVKTIEITMADLQEGAQLITDLKEDLKGKEVEHKAFLNIISQPKHPEVRKLAGAEEFQAFKLRLPRELESQKPEISAMDSSKMTFTLEVDAFNNALKTVNSPKLLSDDLKNVEMTMVSSAAAYAKYEDVLFVATQKSYLEAPEAAKSELREVVLNLPFIPTNLQQQLAEIEEDRSDIYLPVLVGFGREVDLGGKNGYIYTLSDFKALTSTMSETMPAMGADDKASMEKMKEQLIAKYGEAEFAAMKEAHQMAMEEMPDMDNASVLIWTKDGNLYGLIGNKTDAELAKIARSVR